MQCYKMKLISEETVCLYSFSSEQLYYVPSASDVGIITCR
jgi:hypothetical protein